MHSGNRQRKAFRWPECIQPAAPADLNQAGQRPNQFNFGSSADAKVDGVDVEAGWQVAEGFTINGAFSYAKSKMKNQLIACNDLNGDGVPDTTTATPTLAQLLASTGGEAVAECRVKDPISFEPKVSATLQSEYARPIGANTFIADVIPIGWNG